MSGFRVRVDTREALTLDGPRVHGNSYFERCALSPQTSSIDRVGVGAVDQ